MRLLFSELLQRVQHIKIEEETVGKYLGYLEDAYLFSGAKHYLPLIRMRMVSSLWDFPVFDERRYSQIDSTCIRI